MSTQRRSRQLNRALVAVSFGLLGLGIPAWADGQDAGQADDSAHAIAAAQKWFDAFRRADIEALKAQTHFPFAFRSPPVSECKSAKAATAAKLPDALRCLFTTDILATDLKDKGTMTSEGTVLAKGALPRWAKRWAKSVPPKIVPIGIEVSANGTAHQIILLVGPEGVEELWKNTTFDSG